MLVNQGALLQALGCTAYATENAAHFDDDLAFQRAVQSLDVTDPASLATFGSWAGEQRGAELRAHFLQIAATVGAQATQSSCEASRALGTRLGLRPGAIAALDHVHERWDGLGIPGTCSRNSLSLTVRVMHLATQAVIAHRTGGSRTALAVAGHRAGGHLDPELVALVLVHPDPLLAALQTPDPFATALASEPPPKARVNVDALDGLAEAFGDLADLKCRFTLGHSRGVALLAFRIAGGKIAEEWTVWDALGLLQQVGRGTRASLADTGVEFFASGDAIEEARWGLARHSTWAPWGYRYRSAPATSRSCSTT